MAIEGECREIEQMACHAGVAALVKEASSFPRHDAGFADTFWRRRKDLPDLEPMIEQEDAEVQVFQEQSPADKHISIRGMAEKGFRPTQVLYVNWVTAERSD